MASRPVITLQGVSELLAEMAKTPMGWRLERIAFAGYNDDDEAVYRFVVVNEDTAIERYITSYIPWLALARQWSQEGSGDGDA